jgi:hypothetical protein
MASKQSTNGYIGGFILLGMGGIILVAQLMGAGFWASFWPFLIVAGGGLFFVGMVAGGKGSGALAIPGSILTTVGLLLLLQNTYGIWHIWSYAWALIIIAAGVGIFLKGLWNEEERARRAGLNVMTIGVIFLLVFGAFFELGFGLLGFNGSAKLLAPMILIGLGIFLVLRASGIFGGRTLQDGDSTLEPVLPGEMPADTPAR